MRWFIVSVVVLCASCDAARDGSFRGQALARFSVSVTQAAAPIVGDGPLRAALAWFPSDRPDEARSGEAREQVVDGQVGHVDFEVLEPPARSAWRTDSAALGIVGELAIAQVVAYADRDGDARLSPGEPIRGIDRAVLVFTPDGAEGPPIGRLAPGFHRMEQAPCFEGARFLGPFEGDGGLWIGPKWEIDLFALGCGEPVSPCTDLESLRALCWDDPANAQCHECAGAVFPVGASAAECDAFRQDCEARYDPAECEAQWQHCRAGDAPCPKKCRCNEAYNACLAEADAATCEDELITCMQ